MRINRILKNIIPRKVLCCVREHKYRRKMINWKRLFDLSDSDLLKKIDRVYTIDKSNVSQNRKSITFLAEHVTGRCYRMAKALSLEGWNVTVLYGYNSFFVNVSIDDFKTVVSNIVYYKDFNNMLYNLYMDKSSIVHYFTTWGCCDEAQVIIKHKSIFAPIIVERYDVLCGMYNPDILGYEGQYGMVFEKEKYVLENSVGVCQRDYSFEYLIENKRFELPRWRITFLDYPITTFSDKNIVNQQSELSLCYVGGVCTEKEYPKSIYSCHMKLAYYCAENKCHYHIYPSFWDEERFSGLIELEKKNNYFHLHHPIQYSKLSKEISQYDYGVFPVTGEYKGGEIENLDHTKEKIIYSGTNKYFDYISAGLPIIGCVPIRLTEELEKEGIIIRWSIEEYDFDFLKKNRFKFAKRVKENTMQWSMKENIGRLEDFYNEIIVGNSGL